MQRRGNYVEIALSFSHAVGSRLGNLRDITNVLIFFNLTRCDYMIDTFPKVSEKSDLPKLLNE